MSDSSQTPDRSTVFASLFMDHPASVDETYLQHMRFAFTFAFWLATAAGADIPLYGLKHLGQRHRRAIGAFG